ncbi:MAG: hypothetical protein M1451_10265 [Acidobacteria bacterium]|nr:hypothetical protein [Acidobacteriota bacterium]
MRTHSRSGFNLEILVLLFVLLCLQGANAQAPAAQAQAQTPAHQASTEAPPFINGVLDALHKALEKKSEA